MCTLVNYMVVQLDFNQESSSSYSSSKNWVLILFLKFIKGTYKIDIRLSLVQIFSGRARCHGLFIKIAMIETNN